jgi:hypothetical protein
MKQEMKSAGEVGCLRAVLAASISFGITMSIGIAVYKSFGIWQTVVAVIASLCICAIIVWRIANSAKRLTVFDCAIPLFISIIAGVIFAPISLFTASIFSSFTCIGAGIFLSLGLFLYRKGELSGYFLILPTLTFIYEILPIELPTDLDNLLALGADSANFILAGIFRKIKMGGLIERDSKDGSD